MKCLVTGCAGYIGSLLTQQLLAFGHDVVGVDNLFYDNVRGVLPNLGHPNFTFIKDCAASHRMLPLIKDANTIFPFAALVGAPVCDKFPDLAEDINLTAIQAITSNIDSHQRIIYPNTNSGYGIKEGVCTEDDSLTPISHYGRLKCDAEKLVREHRNSAVLRLATVFGTSPRPRFDLMVNDFVAKAHFNGGIEVFEPKFRRNFVHVRDVVRACIWSIDPSMQGVYNVGLDSANCTKYELAMKVCGLTAGHVTIGKGTDPDKRDYNVSSEKLLKTGFHFQYTLEYGIREVAKLCTLVSHDFIKSARNV